MISCDWHNGSAEWNFRMEVHSRVEFQSGSASVQEWDLRVELNGPYGLPYHSMECLYHN